MTKKIKNKHSFLNFILVLILLFNQIAFAQEEASTKIGDLNKVKLQAVLTPPYVIGPGDQLTIIDRTLREVFGQVEQYNITVSADGYISIPLPDGTQESILAAGSTLEELSGEVRKLFSKTLKNPLVYIQINKYRAINIYIGGEVVKPGVYKIETSLASDVVPLTQAIQLAGGLKPRADIKNITVTRGANLEKKIIDLKAFITGNSESYDINLQPGDTIFVKAAENVEDQAQSYIPLLGKLAFQDVSVNVVGEVSTAGNFIFPNDATLLDAIGKAGGISEVGTLEKIRLSRYDEDGVYRTHDINIHNLIFRGSSFDEISLRPNDTVEVLASKGKVTRHFFREIANNLISLSAAGLTTGFANFAVQDNLLNRLGRGGGKRSLPGNTTPITIIGGKRVFNEIRN